MVRASIRWDESTQCLQVVGDVCFDTVVSLRDAGIDLMRAQQAPVVFDLSLIEKMRDSSGLLLLLAWIRQGRKTNQVVQFNNISPALVDFAKLCGLSTLIEMNRQNNG
jgi:ABC-type transporter Mla MlaB component